MVLLSMMLMVMGVLFVSSMQPMFMISMLILIMLMYSYMIYVMLGSYWFSYALVMVMLSGVLVLFTYMVSLLPNEMFENYNFIYVMGILMFIGMMYWVLNYNMKWGMVSLNLWFSYIGLFNIFMVSFLLSIMLLVVWMSYMGYGALRL